jgi:transmembrane sensor
LVGSSSYQYATHAVTSSLRAMSDDRHAIDPSLLDRYFAGECTPEEEATIRAHFGGADPRAALRDALQSADVISRFDSTRAWNDVRTQIRPPRRRSTPWMGRFDLVRIAAAIAFIVGGSLAVPRIIARSRIHVPPTLVESTGIGERRDVRLSDGTNVTLAPRSVLTFPAQFGNGPRTVSLIGEASFSVVHDSTRPFSVRVSGVTARDLGTEFNIREDTAAHIVDVVVASGRVRLETPSDSAGPVLTARQLGHVDVNSGRITVRKDVALDAYMSWRSGHVRFDRAPLREVISELQRWFDVDVLVPDSALASRTVSADLRVGNGASLDVVLSALTLAIDARYVREGRTVTVSPR